ncbi:MAG: hypothetical protein CM1200mP27_12090 [Chloroflexota bacterium]|nr:MAG: hypothetical protein CM1200mP27_12090 [Chloroflexota bacterium]
MSGAREGIDFLLEPYRVLDSVTNVVCLPAKYWLIWVPMLSR